MAVFKNIGIAEYFKRYGYKFGILRGVFMSMPLQWVNDKENRKILYYRKVKRTLKCYVAKYSNVEPKGLEFGKCNLENPVWVYWKQGLDAAPEIVKTCIKSQRKYEGENLIILTDDNLTDYIRMPRYITELVEKGNMSSAAYSDLIRYSLLEHYGGTWVDSTVFLSAPIPDAVKCSDFFAFRDTFGLIENPAWVANWFVHCSKENTSMREIRNVMFAYWTRNRYVVEYLLCYIVMTLVLDKNGELNRMPYANSDYSHLLFSELAESFNTDKYSYLTSLTEIHKLSYKIEDSVLKSQGTFYTYLINKWEE